MADVPPYRLRWDDKNLILEEWDEGLGYVEKAKSRSGVSNPVSAGHPELKALLKETLKRIKDNWLDPKKPISIMLAPPWGSGWLLELEDLPPDVLEEMVEWELSQRLDSDLEDYIYAWQPIGQRVYAFVVRPEIIAFWEEMVRSLRMNVHSITLYTGLVPADVEMSADLLTLYKIWQRHHGKTPTGSGAVGLEDEKDELDTSAFESADEREERKQVPRKSGGSVLKIVAIVVAALVIILGGAGAYVFTHLDGPKAMISGLIQRIYEMKNGEQAPVLTMASSLLDMYHSADTLGVAVDGLVLQGDEMRLLINAKEEPMMTWAQHIASLEGFDSLRIGASVPGTQDLVFYVKLHATGDSTLSEIQMLDNLKLLGLSPDPSTHAVLTKAQRDELLNLFDAAALRPYRLSIHRGAEEDQYFLAGLP